MSQTFVFTKSKAANEVFYLEYNESIVYMFPASSKGATYIETMTLKNTAKSKIVEVTSSNDKVVPNENIEITSKYVFDMDVVGIGTTTLKIKTKDGSAYQCKFKTVEYEKPVSKLLLGGKNYAKYLKKASVKKYGTAIYTDWWKGYKTISITPEKDWKIDFICNKDTGKFVTNGGKIKQAMYLVKMMNKKTKAKISFTIGYEYVDNGDISVRTEFLSNTAVSI